MAWQQIASGGIIDIQELSYYEGSIDEEQRGRLELDMRMSISHSLANQLQNELSQRGVAEVHVSTNSPLLVIEYRKGFPWLAVIAAAILAIAVLAVLIIGWRLFKEIIPAGLQPVVGTIGVVVLLGLGALLLSKAVRR